MISNSEPFRRTHATKRVMACDGRNKLLASVAGLCYILLYHQRTSRRQAARLRPKGGGQEDPPTHPNPHPQLCLDFLLSLAGRTGKTALCFAHPRPCLLPPCPLFVPLENPSAAGAPPPPPPPFTTEGDTLHISYSRTIRKVYYGSRYQQARLYSSYSSSSIQHTSYSSY